MRTCKHGHYDGAMHNPCYQCRAEYWEREARNLRILYEGAIALTNAAPQGGESTQAKSSHSPEREGSGPAVAAPNGPLPQRERK